MITLIGRGIADAETQFYYIGPLDECDGCRFNGICNNLEPGSRYRIMEVRDQEHECPGLDDETVVAVEVEKTVAPVIVPTKGLLEGVTISYSFPSCDRKSCINRSLCEPLGLKEGSRLTVVSIDGGVECSLGNKLSLVSVFNDS